MAKDTAERVAPARSQPGRLPCATDGMGASLHLTATMIALQAGMNMVHLPSKSGPQALTDVAGGSVDLARRRRQHRARVT